MYIKNTLNVLPSENSEIQAKIHKLLNSPENNGEEYMAQVGDAREDYLLGKISADQTESLAVVVYELLIIGQIMLNSGIRKILTKCLT